MTKVQLKTEVLNVAKEMKASKALQAKLEELMEQYAESANRDTVKRDKFITIDGNDYAWCIRHEVYEPIGNFKDTVKTDKRVVACKLAYKYFDALGKEVTRLNKELMDKALAGEDVQQIAAQLNKVKEVRAGRYNFADNAQQFPEIEGYNYDDESFIKEDV